MSNRYTDFFSLPEDIQVSWDILMSDLDIPEEYLEPTVQLLNICNCRNGNRYVSYNTLTEMQRAAPTVMETLTATKKNAVMLFVRFTVTEMMSKTLTLARIRKMIDTMVNNYSETETG